MAGTAGLLWSQLRTGWGRAVALGLGVVVATTSFTVLTGGTEVERLALRGEIEAAESGYHILVRPHDSRSRIETERGLVRPYQLSGLFGGIGLDDYEAIRDLAGVAAAAPVAVVGYVMTAAEVTVDAGPLPPDTGRELLVADVVYATDRGLTTIGQPAVSFSYRTENPAMVLRHGGTVGLVEQLPDGSAALVCPLRRRTDLALGGPTEAARDRSRSCQSSAPGGASVGPDETPPDRRGVTFEWAFPILVAAVDPRQESLLNGGDDVPAPLLALGAAAPATGGAPVPVVLADDPHVDAQARVTVRRLPDVAADQFATGLPADELTTLLTGYGGDLLTGTTVTAQEAYDALLDQVGTADTSLVVDSLWTTGPTHYDDSVAGALVPRQVEPAGGDWRSPLRAGGYVPVPPTAIDAGFRPVYGHPGADSSLAYNDLPRLQVMDVFDLAEVEVAEYEGADGLAASDPRTRQLLGGEQLQASGDPTGYHLGPPTAYMRLSDLGALAAGGVQPAAPAAPISAIRVRVDGVAGTDPVALERVRLVADRIHARTGLDVDVMLGGSATSQTVVLAAGDFGRPALTVVETWLRKGVAVAMLEAVDGKSLALFVLVLAVCALFVANITAVAVRSRRRELTLLSRLGWSRSLVLALLLSEIAVIGAAAGVAGALVSLAIGLVAGPVVTPARAALAVPVAVVVAVVAAAWPAWRASRPVIGSTRPPPAVPATRAGRVRPVRGVTSLALVNVLRSPGRTALGGGAVALGVAALTSLLAISLVFEGAVVGSLLGGAVSIHAREIDYVAAAVMIALSSAGVAEVAFLEIRDRRAELAVLHAVGWSGGRVRRLVLTEAALVGLAGSIAGAAVGLVVAAGLAGELPPALFVATAVTAVGGTLMPVLASLVPAARLPWPAVATTLSRDA